MRDRRYRRGDDSPLPVAIQSDALLQPDALEIARDRRTRRSRGEGDSLLTMAIQIDVQLQSLALESARNHCSRRRGPREVDLPLSAVNQPTALLQPHIPESPRDCRGSRRREFDMQRPEVIQLASLLQRPASVRARDCRRRWENDLPLYTVAPRTYPLPLSMPQTAWDYRRQGGNFSALENF